MYQVCIEMNIDCRVLRNHGFPRVSVVDGGFFAVHEYIRRLNKLEWLVDHSRETCEGICLFSGSFFSMPVLSSLGYNPTSMGEE